ncbi:hypothetical protein KM043_007883 [Ampulex compressa]|nr:hypothetical protein KM043_007883 [Ampulex compressa]
MDARASVTTSQTKMVVVCPTEDLNFPPECPRFWHLKWRPQKWLAWWRNPVYVPVAPSLLVKQRSPSSRSNKPGAPAGGGGAWKDFGGAYRIAEALSALKPPGLVAFDTERARESLARVRLSMLVDTPPMFIRRGWKVLGCSHRVYLTSRTYYDPFSEFII